MSDIAIRVENLSKLYHIGARQQRHDTLRDALGRPLSTRQPIAKAANRPNRHRPLGPKDVSFEVKRGEVVGIIGRNGAGKSTLLKILSRITEPTSGRAEIHGRVGSPAGGGHRLPPRADRPREHLPQRRHPGHEPAEIDRKFDEIVAFAEIEKFLDTPVKRYSSGMYVRLAFAVAAHLEPEILLVDEVLAVGDAAFQKKCLGKMGDVAKEGRTVLFVSHNMAAVESLSRYAILLSEGRVVEKASTDKVTQVYLKSLRMMSNTALADRVDEREGNGRLRFTEFALREATGDPIDFVQSGQDVIIEIGYQSQDVQPLSSIVMSIGFYHILGQPLFLCRSDLQGTELVNLQPNGSVFCRIPRMPLPPGEFRVNLHGEVNGIVADWVRDACTVTVVEGDFYGSGRLPPRSRGDLLVEHYWSADRMMATKTLCS